MDEGYLDTNQGADMLTKASCYQNLGKHDKGAHCPKLGGHDSYHQGCKVSFKSFPTIYNMPYNNSYIGVSYTIGKLLNSAFQ